MAITFIKKLASSILSPSSGKVTFFVDENGLPKVKDESGAVSDFVGPQGADGNSPDFIFGTTPPIAPANVGDVYLNTSNGDIYEFGPTVWVLKGNIRGPSGLNGTDGADGQDGIGVPSGGTTGQVLVKVSNADYDTGWVNQKIRSVLSSNISSTSTTLANATGLSISLPIGVFNISGRLLYSTAAGTTGMRIGATTPSFSGYSVRVGLINGGDGTGALFNGILNSSGDSVVSTGTPAGTNMCMVEGVIVVTAAGTYQLTFASEVGGSAVNILSGSFIEGEVL